MLYGIVNLVCIVWLWRLAWGIGRGTSERGNSHFWKSFGISCAASAGVKFLGALLEDARTPIESALLYGLLAGLVGMVVIGLLISGLAWCIARPFRIPAVAPPRATADDRPVAPVARSTPPAARTVADRHYFISTGGSESGPFVLAQIRSMWASGSITADSHYWSDGMADWQPVTQLLSCTP